MIWTIDQEPENGIMFRGQSTVRVKNRRGETGEARVEYYPVCRVVGPVMDVADTGREAEVIDSRPTFR